jgi:hypothetical protein
MICYRICRGRRAILASLGATLWQQHHNGLTANRHSLSALSPATAFHEKSFERTLFVHALQHYIATTNVRLQRVRRFDRRVCAMGKSKKTVPELGKAEVRPELSTKLPGRYSPGFCATVLSNGEILMGHSSPNGTVTPGYVGVALGSNFKRPGIA